MLYFSHTVGWQVDSGLPPTNLTSHLRLPQHVATLMGLSISEQAAMAWEGAGGRILVRN